MFFNLLEPLHKYLANNIFIYATCFRKTFISTRITILINITNRSYMNYIVLVV